MIEIIGALTFRALSKTLFSSFTWPTSSNDIAIFYILLPQLLCINQCYSATLSFLGFDIFG